MPTGISDTVTLGGRKTSIVGDHVKKCQQHVTFAEPSSKLALGPMHGMLLGGDSEVNYLFY
jgi:hypothetical protein